MRKKPLGIAWLLYLMIYLLSAQIVDLLQQCIDSNVDLPGDGELEIDTHAVSITRPEETC